MGRNELIRAVQSVVLQFPIKKMAEQQDSTTRAVESQRNGESAMSLLACANLCQTNPRARALLAPLFGFSGHHTDPDFMEGMEKLAMGYLRQQLNLGAGAPEVHAMDNAEDAGGETDRLTGDLFEPRGSA